MLAAPRHRPGMRLLRPVQTGLVVVALALAGFVIGAKTAHAVTPPEPTTSLVDVR
jgi:hypothetical protein